MKKWLPIVLLLPVLIFSQELAVTGYYNFDGAETNVYFGDAGVRGLTAGSDLDGDGKPEIIASRYANGSGVTVLEMNGNAAEVVWFSDTTTAGATTYYSGTRIAQTADFDNDGNGEIVFFRGRYSDDPNHGLYVYEYNGTDNGYDLAFFNNLNILAGDTISYMTIEYFVVDDVDGDGTQEIILATNGTSWGVNRSEDFFSVLSIDQFGTPFANLVEEYYVSAREVSGLGGGSAINVATCDTDGDGLREVYCHAWNSHNNFFFEATGPDTYTLGDTTSVQISYGVGDHVSLMNPAVADMDGDGKDEVYVSNYYSGDIYRLVDNDGDATHFTNDEVDTLALGAGAAFGAVAATISDFEPTNGVFFGGSVASGGDLIRWNGTKVRKFTTDADAGGFIAKMAAADMDGDGYDEIVSAHQSVVDSVESISGTDTTMILNPKYWTIRLTSHVQPVESKDFRIVLPSDYKLGNAYPNPFNPMTNIEFTLPLQKEISLVVYNLKGQEVVRLIDTQTYQPGNHVIQWNGRDAFGHQVASGTYIYTLRYGNFHLSKQVTLLK